MYQSIHHCMLCISMSYFFIKFSLPPKKNWQAKRQKRPPLKKKKWNDLINAMFYFFNIFGILPLPFKSSIFSFVKFLYLFEISLTNGRICNDKLKKDGFDLWITLLAYISIRYQGDALTLELQILSGNSWAFLQGCESFQTENGSIKIHTSIKYYHWLNRFMINQ